MLLILFAWGPIEATQKLTGILLIAVLSLFGTQMLRRQTAAEFPDARLRRRMDVRCATGWPTCAARFATRTRQPARRGQGTGGGATAAPRQTPVERLESLGLPLHARGALTDEEYATAKRELLLAWIGRSRAGPGLTRPPRQAQSPAGSRRRRAGLRPHRLARGSCSPR